MKRNFKMSRENKKKAVIVGIALLAWINSTSVAYVPHEKEAPVEAVECIDRREAGIVHELGVVRSDGTYNHVALNNEAIMISKVIYGTARNNSDDQKETVVWCILNRVENGKFPNTVEEVCKQKQQFEGFSIYNDVDDDTYNLVYRLLCDYYKNGYRISNKSFVYMYATSSNVYLRDTFETNGNTNYWRADEEK